MKIEIKLKTPDTPNFIICETLGLMQDGTKALTSIPIQMLSDKQLSLLADEWREHLLQKAKERRK